MNRKDTLAALNALGLHASFVKETGEYRLAPGYILAGGRGFQAQQAREEEAKAYYTTDRQDALDTGRAMVERREHRLPGHFHGY